MAELDNQAAAENTDRVLWTDPAASIFDPARVFVTKEGGIGIQCNGLTIVKPLVEWHALAQRPLPAELVERPLVRLTPDNGRPAWQQVNDLFERYGLAPPDWRMRDELVSWLAWARYADALSRPKADGALSEKPMHLRGSFETEFGKFEADEECIYVDPAGKEWRGAIGEVHPDGEADFVGNDWSRGGTYKWRFFRKLAAPSATPQTEAVEDAPRPKFEDVLRRAVLAVRDLDDWTNVNETEFTGWGDGDVPPEAEFWRVKSGQALRALLELRGAEAMSKEPRTHASPRPDTSMVMGEIAAERERQQSVEGWTTEHDDAHTNGEMAKAAGCYAVAASFSDWQRSAYAGNWFNLVLLRRWWPWDQKWWKPTDRRRDLVKAGALIVAEIERLDRAAHPTEQD